MLTALAPISAAHNNTYRSGSFQRDKFVGVELAGKKGIIGLGLGSGLPGGALHEDAADGLRSSSHRKG